MREFSLMAALRAANEHSHVSAPERPPRSTIFMPVPPQILQFSSGMLGYGKKVAVWIFEPGHLGSARRDPDAQIVLLEETEEFEYHARCLEFQHGRADVLHVPSENGVWGWLHLLCEGDAKMRAAAVEDQGEIVLGQQRQSQRVAKEGAGTIGIRG